MATEAQKSWEQYNADRRDPFLRRRYPEKPKEPDPDAEETYRKYVDSVKRVSNPKTIGVEPVDVLSGGDAYLLDKAAREAGVDTRELLITLEKWRPGSIDSYIRQKKGDNVQGAPPSRFGAEEDIQTPKGRINSPGRSVKGRGKTEVDFDKKPRPTIEDALGPDGSATSSEARKEVEKLKAAQRQFPTGENIAREAARQRPMDSWSRAEQYLEDLDSVSDSKPFKRETKGTPLAPGEQGPEEMAVPRATYAGKGSGRPVGPGGKAEGSQADYSAYRTQKSIDDAVAERNRQAKIDFLRKGGRYAADGIGTSVGGKQVSLERDPGQKIAVIPGRGKLPPDQRSGAYAYADELRDEARLAEDKQNRQRMEDFVASLGEPSTELGRKREQQNIRDAEAREFLSTTRSRIRTTEKMARDLKTGRVGAGTAEGINDFYRSLDEAKAAKAQLQGKDQKQQEAWARDVLDARREEQKRLAEEEELRRRRVAQSTFQDIVNNRRAAYTDRY